MPDIVIAEFMDEGAVRDLLNGYEVLHDPTLVDKPEELCRAAAQSRALIVRNRTQVRGPLLEAASRLEVVGRLGVGLDNIDVAACRARGITVFPATGANDDAVAEYVIATALVLLRTAYGASAEVIAGGWPRNRLMGREISGKCLGLIGFGAIAQATARRASALGMEIMAYDPYLDTGHTAWLQPWGAVTGLPLDDVLSRADVVSLHVPLTAETRNLIDGNALGRMRSDAILINAARGGVVDEVALATALKAGRLGGAALDVFDEEPLSGGSGAIFAGCPNLILTPHIAGVTIESNIRVSRVIAKAVAETLAVS